MKRKLLQLTLATIAIMFSINVQGQLSGYYQEDFEGTFPPTGWQTVDVLDNANQWEQFSGSDVYSGYYSAHINYSNYVDGEDWLILPQFTVAATDSFSFWLAADFVGYPPDNMDILISTTDDNIASFTTVLASLSEGVNYPITQDVFEYYAYSLAAFDGQNIYIAFKHTDNYGDGVFVDLVTIGSQLDVDAEATSIELPTVVSTVSSIVPKATVTNNSLTSQSFDVTMTITGGYSSTMNVANLAAGASQQIDFDTWLPAATGDYTVSIQTQLVGDQASSNDALSKVVTAYDPISGYYQEDFEGAFPPPAWQIKNVLDQSSSWQQLGGLPYSGYYSTYLMYSPAYIQGEDWMILPQFAVSATDSFSFWFAVANSGYPPDSTYILVSTTDSYLSSFTNTLGVLSEGDNYPTSYQTYQYYSFSLAAYAGQNIYVALKNRNMDGDGVFVDLVSIGTPPTINATAISIDVPDYLSTATISPIATVQNNSLTAETFTATLTATGGYSSTMTVTNLAAGATQQITFDPWSPIAGNLTLSLTTNLAGDTYALDDNITKDVNVLATFTNFGWTVKADALHTYYDGALAAVNHPNGTSELYLLAGASGGYLTTDASVFDPLGNSWSALTPMPVANLGSCGAAINGKIYLVGGFNYYYTGDNQIYDIATNSWSAGTAMPSPVGDYAFGVYHDSLIYYLGGSDLNSGLDLDVVQIYDPGTDTWTTGTNLPVARRGWQGGIAGNKIVVSGGVDDNLGTLQSSTYVGTIDPLNPANITWIQADDFPAGTNFRPGAGNTIDPASGLVVFTGGDPTGSGATTTAATFGYDVNSNVWKLGPDKPTAANNLRNLACVVYNDSMYMASVGGFDGTNELRVNEWLNMGPAPLGTSITEATPASFNLTSYPNPFSNFTSISFSLDHASTVKISVVDVPGKEIAELWNKTLSAGPQQLVWDASGYPAGVYFIKLNVDGNVFTQKVVKLK